jgi:hypothetical protein
MEEWWWQSPMSTFLAGAMIMGAMCTIIVNVDLQVAGQRTLAVVGTLVAVEVEVEGVNGNGKEII